MPWFGPKNDPLAEKERLLRSQINQVQKKINQLKRAEKLIDKKEGSHSKLNIQSSNPFEQQLEQLKSRPKLFQNPGDEEKYRLHSKDRTEAHGFEPEPEISEENSDAEPVAEISSESSGFSHTEHHDQSESELNSSLEDLIKASKEDEPFEEREDNKFLKYLAAGNLEGMQRLQFEKGVDRNRKILTFIFLVIVISAIYLYWKNM